MMTTHDQQASARGSGAPNPDPHRPEREYAKVISDLQAAALAHVGSHPTAHKRIKKAIVRYHDRILRRLETIAGDDPDPSLQPPSAADRDEVARALDGLRSELQLAREQLDRLFFERHEARVIVRDVPGNLLDKQALLRQLDDCEAATKKLRSAIDRPLELGPLEWDPEEFDPTGNGSSDATDPPEVRQTKASKLTMPDLAMLWLAQCWHWATGEYPRMSVNDTAGRAGRGDKGAFAEWVTPTLMNLAPGIYRRLRAADPVKQSLRRLQKQGLLPPT